MVDPAPGLQIPNEELSRVYPHSVIEPPKGWAPLDLGELWKFRELLFFLAWRDIMVRYKQTALGAAWAIIQPFFTMVVFSLFFGRLAGVPSDGVPYPIFSYTALVPWTFFANGLALSANSLVGSANLISKVYFPRLIVPTATILSGIVDFVLAFIVLIGMMATGGGDLYTSPVGTQFPGMAIHANAPARPARPRRGAAPPCTGPRGRDRPPPRPSRHARRAAEGSPRSSAGR